MPSAENRPFDSLQVGEEERLVHVLTKEDFSLLAAQAAAFAAGVVDPAVAASPAFRADSAQSGWGSALMSALIAGRLPGAGSKLVRQSIETSAAAAPGDIMTVVARVMAKSANGRVTIEARATNQRGELAMAGTAEIVAPKKTIAAEPPNEYFELFARRDAATRSLSSARATSSRSRRRSCTRSTQPRSRARSKPRARV